MAKDGMCPSFNKKDLQRLFELTESAMKKDMEIATFLCGSMESPKLGNVCTGGKCEVDVHIPKRCPNGTEPLGLFHTHPHTKPWTNETDAKASAHEGLIVSCVGGNDKAPWIIAGGEEPAPIKNLVVRCHVVKSPKARQQVAEKSQEAERLYAEAMRRADMLSEKLKLEGKDFKTIIDERIKQFESVDKARANLSKFVYRQWGLRTEGCVLRKR